MGGDEFELVKEAFATNWIAPLGPHVNGFEKEFSNVIRDLVIRYPLIGTQVLLLRRVPSCE